MTSVYQDLRQVNSGAVTVLLKHARKTNILTEKVHEKVI